MWDFCFVTMYYKDHLPKLRLKDCQEPSKGISAKTKYGLTYRKIQFLGIYELDMKRLGQVSCYKILSDDNPRITEWFGLEGNHSPYSPNPCPAQGPIQPGLEYLQGWGTTAFLGSCASASPPSG